MTRERCRETVPLIVRKLRWLHLVTFNPLNKEMLMQHYQAAIEFNTRVVNAAIEYWTALAFPSLYMAKQL